MIRKLEGIAPILILVVPALIGLGIVSYLVVKPALAPASPTPTPTTTLAPTTTCVIGGCNGEICQGADEEPLTSICLYKPEYVCYKDAICEIQESGKCGWTQTNEFRQCLEKHK